MFSCQICEIFQNTYLEEHLRTTSSKHGSDDDYRQVHAHTHFHRPVAPHNVNTSLHQRPIKQALHHTNI